MIKDSVCSSVVVSEEVLSDADVSNCPKASVADYLGRVEEFPVVRCYLRCHYFVGRKDVVRGPIKFAGALIKKKVFCGKGPK